MIAFLSQLFHLNVLSVNETVRILLIDLQLQTLK